MLAAVALVLAGCGGGAKGPPPEQIVAAATKATSAERSFHFVYDEQHGPPSNKGLHLIYADGDVVLPGNVKADVTGTLLGLPLRSTLIVVGGRYYIRNPFTQAWQTVSVATNPVAFFNPAKGVLAVIAGATQVKSAGSEKVGGQDAYRVKGKVPVSAISPILGNPPSPSSSTSSSGSTSRAPACCASGSRARSSRATRRTPCARSTSRTTGRPS